MIKVVLFDVDGVLVDSKGANYQYVRDTMKKFGYDVSRKDYEMLFHHTGRAVVKALVPGIDEAELEEIRKHQNKVSSDYFRFARLNPGVRETLEWLEQKGIRMGVVTNRSSSAGKILEFFNIGSYFDVVVTAGDVEKQKPDPEPLMKAVGVLGVVPAEAAYIGDSESDVDSANAAGLVSVFYSDKGNKNAKFSISDMDGLRALF